jgi:hypothetical protein
VASYRRKKDVQRFSIVQKIKVLYPLRSDLGIFPEPLRAGYSYLSAVKISKG